MPLIVTDNGIITAGQPYDITSINTNRIQGAYLTNQIGHYSLVCYESDGIKRLSSNYYIITFNKNGSNSFLTYTPKSSGETNPVLLYSANNRTLDFVNVVSPKENLIKVYMEYTSDNLTHQFSIAPVNVTVKS